MPAAVNVISNKPLESNIVKLLNVIVPVSCLHTMLVSPVTDGVALISTGKGKLPNTCALLKRAGYEAHTFTIEPKGIGTGGVTRHTVAIYKVNGKIYKLADTNELGVIKGPFQSDEEVAKSLAGSLNALNWYYRDVRKYGW